MSLARFPMDIQTCSLILSSCSLNECRHDRNFLVDF